MDERVAQVRLLQQRLKTLSVQLAAAGHSPDGAIASGIQALTGAFPARDALHASHHLQQKLSASAKAKDAYV